jgi:GT2 family glycosyltransferase
MDETYTREAPPGLRVLSCELVESSQEVPVRLKHPERAIRVQMQPTSEFNAGLYNLEVQFRPEGVVDLIVSVLVGEADQFWLRPAALDRNHFAVNLRVIDRIGQITLFVVGSGEVRQPTRFSFARTNRIAWSLSTGRRALRVLKREPLRFMRSAALALWGLTRPGTIVTSRGSAARLGEAPYDTWIRIFDEKPIDHQWLHAQRRATLVRQPLLSCLSWLSDTNVNIVKGLIRDLAQQIYPHWQLVIAVPAPLLLRISAELDACGIDPRSVTVILSGPDAASTYNALLAAATGEFVVKIAPGATLRPHALLELALVLDRFPDAEIIYSDEDAIDQHGNRSNPRFKPAWSPDYLVAYDYLGDLTMLRRQTVQQVGGWRPGFEDTCDHDLKLRITERLVPRTIIHLAKVLVHLPCSRERVLSTAHDVNSLRDLIKRRQCRAVVKGANAGPLRVRYLPKEPAPLVSLIIPTRDRADLLELCVRSILQRTAYPSIEIIIVDNDSNESVTFRLFRSLQQEPRVRIMQSPGAFNFSALNNRAVGEARGTILGLINNDVEIIEPEWLDEMVGLAERPEVGCVGAKLLYPDGRIQHAGVTIGLWGVAGHGQRLLPRGAPGYMAQMRYIHEVSAVTAACLVVRKSVYVQVGGFDEKELKIAFNDVDFCLKVRRAGYRNLWTPFAELLHHESASRGFDYSPAKAKRSTVEANVIRKRWGQALFNDPYYSPNLTLDRDDFTVRVH